jgi:hypothetical protein
MGRASKGVSTARFRCRGPSCARSQCAGGRPRSRGLIAAWRGRLPLGCDRVGRWSDLSSADSPRRYNQAGPNQAIRAVNGYGDGNEQSGPARRGQATPEL